MMDGSFVAFRTLELRALASQLTGDEFKLYILMSTYADGRSGMCYPGLRELMERSGYGKGTVERARNSLERKGLIECTRRDQRDQMTGVQLPNVYVICGPYRLKNEASRSQNQGGPFPNSSTNLYNQNQNQNQLSRINKPESRTSSSSNQRALRAPRKESAQDGESAGTARTAQAKEQGLKHGNDQQQDKSRATTPHPQTQEHSESLENFPRNYETHYDYSAYQSPLPDMEKERMAAALAAELETTTPHARAMADRYALDQIEAALSEMRLAAGAGRIKKSKFGFVQYHLKAHAVAEPEIERAQRSKRLERLIGRAREKSTGDLCYIRRGAAGMTIDFDDGRQYRFDPENDFEAFEPYTDDDQTQEAAVGD